MAMTDKQALLRELDSRVVTYERRMRQAYAEYEAEPTPARKEYYIEMRGKWIAFGEAQRLAAVIL